MSGDTPRPTPPSAEESRPPTPSAEDQLVAQETALFGPVSEYEETGLPPPPYDPKAAAANGVNGVDAAGKKINGVPPRAKRPKNPKISPNKGNKTLARRSVTTSNGQNGPGESMDVGLPNNDYCDACHGKGQFLCCEGGCLRSFHFNCLDPPVELDDLPDESWFCKACRAESDRPYRYRPSLFSELMYQVDCINPKAFALPLDIKSFFFEVASGAGGDFIDTREHRLPSKVTARGAEDRDGYRIKDKTGKSMLCFACNESASITKLRRIVSCDFCDQHWHLDCLDPPMTGMPPPTRKWMCPVHSDHAMPNVRHPKSVTTINVERRFEPNNGDIIIIPRREHEKIADEFDELTVNRIRYQVPEDTVILDFWGRTQNGFKPRTIAPPIRKSLFDQLEAAPRQREGSPFSNAGGSPLTSLGDLSDSGSPRFSAVKPVSRRLDTSALDDLALLADGYHASMVFERERLAAADATKAGSSLLPAAPAPQPTPSSSAATSSILSSPKSTSRATSNGLVIKFAGRNGGGSSATAAAAAPMVKKVSDGDTKMVDRPTRSDKGKGKGKEVDRPTAAGSSTATDSPMDDLQFGGVVPSTQFVPPPATVAPKKSVSPVVTKKAMAIPPFRGGSGSATPVPEKEKEKGEKSKRAVRTKSKDKAEKEKDREVEKKERVIAPLRESNAAKAAAKVDTTTATAVKPTPSKKPTPVPTAPIAKPVVVSASISIPAPTTISRPLPSPAVVAASKIPGFVTRPSAPQVAQVAIKKSASPAVVIPAVTTPPAAPKPAPPPVAAPPPTKPAPIIAPTPKPKPAPRPLPPKIPSPEPEPELSSEAEMSPLPFDDDMLDPSLFSNDGGNIDPSLSGWNVGGMIDPSLGDRMDMSA